MNSFSTSTVLQSLAYFADSIFIGLKIVIPLLLALTLIELKTGTKKTRIWIECANLLMLIGGTFFLLIMAGNIFFAWYSGNEAEREMMIAFLTGPNWFQVALPIIAYSIIPSLMWIKKWRSSIYISFNIVVLWFISDNLVEYLTKSELHGFSNSFDWQEKLLKWGLFLLSLTTIYLIKNKNRKLSDD